MSMSVEGVASQQPYTVGLINPAFLPDYFWADTASLLAESGVSSVTPKFVRDNPAVSCEDGVDVIEAALEPHDRQYIVALSRGVEFAVRYLDRLNKQHKLHKVAGWMVISSVGPKGYEPRWARRHSRAFREAVHINEQGLEVIDGQAAEKYMLHDIKDPARRKQIRHDLLNARPLAKAEIKARPRPSSIPISPTWIIGNNDQIDNTYLSAYIARKFFDAELHWTDWGHVGPLSHPNEVADVIVTALRDTANSETPK